MRKYVSRNKMKRWT